MSEIASVQQSPNISSDPNSNLSKLARQAKEQQLQSQEDTKYDLQIERFTSNQKQTLHLSGLLVAISFLFALSFIGKKR